MYNILICDDDVDIVNALKIYLGVGEYQIFTAKNGLEAVAGVENNQIHLVLMDIMMPELDGIGAMVRIRENSNVPVILLTAKSEDNDKILGLNIGADDYITKPFNPVEVLARVKSQLRRYTQLGSGGALESVLKIRGVEMDDSTKEVTVDGDRVRLTPTEYDILRLLMKNPGKVFSPDEIYSRIWSDSPFGAQNTVAVHIRHLREKIEINPGDPRYIKVVWGQGYKMEGESMS
ncbi:MAG: response regulator transcription factor [Oscillospiraceae bacterium]